ncbi:hypothetical protein SAMN05216464_103242 [Mucilaginibacter pineti]|uniref:Uncharacterized protein n=1 Tax=Mucilaginibacter pineti TaxID=1391627 RepID=A0A1G6Z6Z6_9SPHI|nr:hypothetical protein SAMN05216464_103242 [Mucilaginibacter pineti]
MVKSDEDVPCRFRRKGISFYCKLKYTLNAVKMMNQNTKDDFKNEVLLSISADIARIRKKEDLLHLIRVHVKKVFYFTHASTVLFSSDKKTYRSFIIDPSSVLKKTRIMPVTWSVPLTSMTAL